MAEMGKEKVTWMKLKAKLDSEKNLTKVLKALCQTPQIRDRAFDEKSNIVTVKVVCCSPEEVMKKLCSEGKGAIEHIETIDPPKPVAQKPKEAAKPKEAEKSKEAEKPKPAQPYYPIEHYPPIMGHPYYQMGHPYFIRAWLRILKFGPFLLILSFLARA